jgi:hypothetical protein
MNTFCRVTWAHMQHFFFWCVQIRHVSVYRSELDDDIVDNHDGDTVRPPGNGSVRTSDRCKLRCYMRDGASCKKVMDNVRNHQERARYPASIVTSINDRCIHARNSHRLETAVRRLTDIRGANNRRYAIGEQLRAVVFLTSDGVPAQL